MQPMSNKALFCPFFLFNMAFSLSAATAKEASTAIAWRRWEIALPGAATEGAYRDLVVTASYNGPQNQAFSGPAFWDGTTWNLRCAFPTPGFWKWQIAGSGAGKAGFQGRRGTVSVKPFRGDNPLFQHGFLKVGANQRALSFDDGTPFLWMGDTVWNGGWNATESEWKEYVTTRARQGFSVIQLHATRTKREPGTLTSGGHAPFAPDGTPDTAYWRELDEKIALANDAGLVVLLVGAGKPQTDDYTQQMTTPAFARYLVGRLFGDCVIFSPSMDAKWSQLNKEMGQNLDQNTSRHLITQHVATDFDAAKKYCGDSYLDFSGVQSGHHNGDTGAAYAAARQWTRELWDRKPTKPVINIEAMYDGRGNDNGDNWREVDARKLGWLSWLCGSMGYTYGAGDVRPKVPQGNGGVWRFNRDPKSYDYWRTALGWNSATQMTHLRRFFEPLQWWRLEPASQLIVNQPPDETRVMAFAQTANGDLGVAYLPDNDAIELDRKALPPEIKARWFNPRTGEFAAATMRGDTTATARFERPGAGDWVLLLAP